MTLGKDVDGVHEWKQKPEVISKLEDKKKDELSISKLQLETLLTLLCYVS